jgi:dolichyl-phosphate-mannose-protein mannosyltransferase
MISSHSTFLPMLFSIWNKIPTRIRKPILYFYRWEYFGLFLIVCASLIFHFIIINNTNSLIWDEGHYVQEARSIIAGKGAIFIEQPPLGKLFIVSGVYIFGDNPFGWRFFSIIFGTISIILIYFICRKLEMPKGGPFLATFIFAFENLNFVQSSIAMLDVYMVTFMLASFLLFLDNKPVASGICLALSILSKLTGAFGLIVILLCWLFRRDRNIKSLFILISMVIVTFLILFEGLDSLIFQYIFNPFTLFNEVIHKTRSFTYSLGYIYTASKPWEWILQLRWIFYNYDPQYLAVISPNIWIMIIPVIIYMIRQALKSKTSIMGLSWFAGIFLPICIMVIATKRVTFIYYYYPITGAICLGIGLLLAELYKYWKANSERRNGKFAIMLFAGILLSHAIVFILLSPVALPLIKWFPLGI